ncbi:MULTISPECIES: hypothetical protein [Paraburkholderia]|uniref:hypothetical protein n=1 Tax=Paraburkholderia TaxID=1822464 RepID=UPI0012F6BF86|nr:MULTISPECIES: hypothetical protein [Paraburkholderia]MDR8400515.1 hypothetical protein [Paraburkholderia sp. USG1]
MEQHDEFALPQHALSKKMPFAPGKTIASNYSQCGASPPGHLGQKFSDNRRKMVHHTGRGKIALGR